MSVLLEAKDLALAEQSRVEAKKNIKKDWNGFDNVSVFYNDLFIFHITDAEVAKAVSDYFGINYSQLIEAKGEWVCVIDFGTEKRCYVMECLPQYVIDCYEQEIMYLK